MIINTKLNQNTTIKGNIQSQNFTINATPEAFALLAGGYTDIIGSIIRELSSNAVDAHSDVNKTNIPFDIYLPNIVSPEFKIRDYGPGMSKDEIINVFSSMFTSTKRDSNNSIGGFGIGGKTPLAYHTKTMTIECYQQGVKSTHLAFINDEGYPSINILGEQHTNELDGLSLKFPIKDSDTYVFEEKTKEQLEYFPVKPNIYGVATEKTESFFKIIQSKGTNKIKCTDYDILYSSKSYTFNNKVTVIQGGIGYSVSGSMLTNLLKNEEVTKQLVEYGNIDVMDMFTYVKFQLYVNIGDISLDLTREHIKEDEKTIASISKVFIKAYNTFITQLLEEKKKCKTLKDVKIFSYKYNTSQIFTHDYNSNWIKKYSEVKNKHRIILTDAINTIFPFCRKDSYKFKHGIWFERIHLKYKNTSKISTKIKSFSYARGLKLDLFNKDSVFIINDLVGIRGIKYRIQQVKDKYEYGILFNPYKNKYNNITIKALETILMTLLGNKLLFLSEVTQEPTKTVTTKTQSNIHLVGVRDYLDNLVYKNNITNKSFLIYSTDSRDNSRIRTLFPLYKHNYYYMTEAAEKRYAKKFNFIKVDDDFYEKRFLKFKQKYLDYNLYSIIRNNVCIYFEVDDFIISTIESYHLLNKTKIGNKLFKDFNIDSLESFVTKYKKGESAYLKDIDIFNNMYNKGAEEIKNIRKKYDDIRHTLVKEIPRLNIFYTHVKKDYFTKLFNKIIGV